MTLKGYQLSFVPDVEPYWIENPEIIATASGTATVTRTETIGPSQIIWADYGSGIEHPHQPEDVTVVHPPKNPKVGEQVEVEISLFGDRHWLKGVVIDRQTYLAVEWHYPERGIDGSIVVNQGLTWRYPHPPEQRPSAEVEAAATNTKSRKRRRYPGKGKASGWIETRRTNRKREKPSEYLVYRWQDDDGKHSRYLKGAIAPVVREMIEGGSPVSEILKVI